MVNKHRHSWVVRALVALLGFFLVLSLVNTIMIHVWIIGLILAIPAAFAFGWYVGKRSNHMSVRRSPARTDDIPASEREAIPDDDLPETGTVRRLLTDPRSGVRPIGSE